MPSFASRLPGLIAITLTLSLPVHAQKSAGEAARDQWHTDIGSGYQQLADQSAELSGRLSHLCPAPDEKQTGVTQLKSAWRDALIAWQAVRFVDFGPIEQNSRAWQIQFWPDRKNLVGRKVDAWLKRTDEASPSAIAEAGVAMQGLPAMEYLLFDERFQQSETPGWPKRCALLKPIATHLKTITRQLASDWQAYGNFYRDQGDLTARTAESAMNAVEHLRSRRLGAAMGLGGNTNRNPYLGDAWRSGASLTAQQASLSGLSTYFFPGLKRLLSARDQTGLFDDLTTQTNDTLSEYRSVEQPMTSLLKSDSGYRILQGLYIELSQLEPLLIGRLASALDIQRGFNSSDGD